MASEKFDKRLQSLLSRHGILSEGDAQNAAAQAKEKGKPLTTWIVEAKLADERAILDVLSRETTVSPIDLEKVTVEEGVVANFGQDLAKFYGVVPVSRVDNILTMAVSDPFDVLKLDDVRIITNCDIRPVVSTERGILAAIDRIYNRRQQEMEDLLSKNDGHELVLAKEEEG